MSVRGLVVALLCGLIGLGGGALVAYVVQPRAHDAGSPAPVGAVSPSVPIDASTPTTYATDIPYQALDPDLVLNVVHTIKNDLATWTYHVPQGWKAYGVCTAPQPTDTECPFVDDEPVPPNKVDKQTQVRFRPSDEPVVGGYSLRVKIMDNTEFNPAQIVPTKIVAFRQAFSDQGFSVLRKTQSAVYFTYVASGHLRYNYFQWFAVPGRANATLEMSVSGRAADKPGLDALFNRFADNATGR